MPMQLRVIIYLLGLLWASEEVVHVSVFHTLNVGEFMLLQ